MAEEKEVIVTVAKDGVVHDGEGGFYKKGEKVKVPSLETAESLKEKGFAN